MITYALFCMLWSKPQSKILEVPINEFALAKVHENFGEFIFDADSVDQKMNSVKITYIPSQLSTQAHAGSDSQQRALTLMLEAGDKQASLDCEIKERQTPVNP